MRNEDYERIARKPRRSPRSREITDAAAAEVAAQVVRLRRQLLETRAIDFFGASARDAADGSLAALEARLQEGADMNEPVSAPQASGADALRGKVWVTREAVQVDRIASAWLIRRFIDPAGASSRARPRHLPRTGEVRFDMFEANTPMGRPRTFECCCSAPACRCTLSAIGEIIHDIDLKDGKYGREETAGIRTSYGHRLRQARRRGAAGTLLARCWTISTIRSAGRLREGKMTDVPLNQARSAEPRRAVRRGHEVWARVAALSFGGPAGQIAACIASSSRRRSGSATSVSCRVNY